MSRGSREYISPVTGSLTKQLMLSVVCLVKDPCAESGSATRSMSDSWISWNPRIDEPSKAMPSSKRSSVSSATGIEKCCISPGRSRTEVDDLGSCVLGHGQDVFRRGHRWSPFALRFPIKGSDDPRPAGFPRVNSALQDQPTGARGTTGSARLAGVDPSTHGRVQRAQPASPSGPHSRGVPDDSPPRPIDTARADVGIRNSSRCTDPEHPRTAPEQSRSS